jgi:cell pole-organizing protein PopZ
MEDILASIRRILSEDEAASAPAPLPAPPPLAGEAGVLTLDASMLVAEPPAHDAPAGDDAADLADPVGAPEATPEPVAATEPVRPGLVAPEAMAAAATSLNTLVRTLVERQSMAVHRGGPTLEDIVREEIRPMLKAWLDTNLPPLVERLVAAEIERVIGRAVS